MSDVKYLVVERAATDDERTAAEFGWLDEAVLHALIQYSEYERDRRGEMARRDETADAPTSSEQSSLAGHCRDLIP